MAQIKCFVGKDFKPLSLEEKERMDRYSEWYDRRCHISRNMKPRKRKKRKNPRAVGLYGKWMSRMYGK